MIRVKQIISHIDTIYEIKNNNYNNILHRIDTILTLKKKPLSTSQVDDINRLLLMNNKQIDKNTISKILHIFTAEQLNDIESQFQFLLDMKP